MQSIPYGTVESVSGVVGNVGHLRKYANKEGSRDDRGRGGHLVEPNPYSKINY